MEKRLLQNSILINGIFLGLLTVLISVLKYSLSSNYLEKSYWDQILGFILLVAFVYIAINSFKKSNNSYISLKQSIKIGLGVTLIFAFLNVIYLYFFMSIIEPDFKDKIIEMQIKEMQKSNTPNSQIKMTLEMMEKYFVSITLFVTIIYALITGLITSLIIGAIVKKDANKSF